MSRKHIDNFLRERTENLARTEKREQEFLARATTEMVDVEELKNDPIYTGIVKSKEIDLKHIAAVNFFIKLLDKGEEDE